MEKLEFNKYLLEEINSGSFTYEKLLILRNNYKEIVEKGILIGENWVNLDVEQKLSLLITNLLSDMIHKDGFLEDFSLKNLDYYEIAKKISQHDKVKILNLPIMRFKNRMFCVDNYEFKTIKDVLSEIDNDKYVDVLVHKIRILDDSIQIKGVFIESNS